MNSLGVVKLSDFGVAKILPDIEDCRSTSGTHGYMVCTYINDLIVISGYIYIHIYIYFLYYITMIYL